MNHHEFAADLETPVSAYLKLSPLKPVFLLESVERNESAGRYSFIGIMPKQYFILDSMESGDRFFAALEDCLKGIPTDTEQRFSAGLVGFFSYHAAAILLPRISPRSGGDPLAGFVLPSAVLIFDHFRRRILLSSLLSEKEQDRLAKEIRNCLQRAPGLPPPGQSSIPVPNLSEEEFARIVERAQEHIQAGDIYQVVLSVLFEGETEANPFQMYRALRMINPSPYMFYLNFQERFQFLGSSPETMVRIEGNRMILRPIAGTRPRGKDPQEDSAFERDLLKDQKERAEHLMLLDLARNDLGRLARAGTVRVSEFMKVERYSHVMHLVSKVESETAGSPSLKEIFAAVFPAGTVTGAPKIRAMQIIDELEPHPRGLYAGSIGYISGAGQLDHCISIRSLHISDGRYRYLAGAGIVADSNSKKEYEEIRNKAFALHTMLHAAGEPL